MAQHCPPTWRRTRLITTTHSAHRHSTPASPTLGSPVSQITTPQLKSKPQIKLIALCLPTEPNLHLLPTSQQLTLALFLSLHELSGLASVDNISLTAGQHVMTLVIDGYLQPTGNFDY